MPRLVIGVAAPCAVGTPALLLMATIYVAVVDLPFVIRTKKLSWRLVDAGAVAIALAIYATGALRTALLTR